MLPVWRDRGTIRQPLCPGRARATAGDVSHVSAHGTGTVPGDAAERKPHSLGASGAIEAVATIMAIRTRLVPPTAGHAALDPKLRPLDVVTRRPRPAPDGIVLSGSFGFGGHNGCLVIGPPP